MIESLVWAWGGGFFVMLVFGLSPSKKMPAPILYSLGVFTLSALWPFTLWYLASRKDGTKQK